MRHASRRSRLAAALMIATGFAHATGSTLLPLDAGTYVISSYSPCQDAPLAGVMQFDGHAFLGPHESDCRSVVLDQSGASYHVRTQCRALGDGTPAKPYTEVTGVRIESRTRLVLSHHDRDVEYALCPAFH